MRDEIRFFLNFIEDIEMYFYGEGKLLKKGRLENEIFRFVL